MKISHSISLNLVDIKPKGERKTCVYLAKKGREIVTIKALVAFLIHSHPETMVVAS